MAAFRQHLAVSTAVGVAYSGVLGYVGVEWSHGILGGALCAVSGMLPDLDSSSGKPVREIFGVTAAIAPLLLLHRMDNAGLTPEQIILVAVGLYLLIRFGVAWLFKNITVHRGMFHSLPAALVAAEIAFLAHDCPENYGRWIIGGGVLLGFLSHLVLDELSSIDASGLRIRLNRAAGSAIKLASKSTVATAFTWLLLGVLTYLVAVSEGVLQPIHSSLAWPATVELPGHHRADGDSARQER